jgi:leader peptidase (prepilin peptidase)/N-methyltransferase
MTPEVFALILLTIWGACVGSFLNVVIYRVPAGLSVISPPSRCPKCEKKLAIYDNVPILGWLWLRGKCRYCKAKISMQYPLIEAVTALLFAAVVFGYYFTSLRPTIGGWGLEQTWPILAVHLVLVACMVAATMIDAKLYIIPLRLPWIAALTALVVYPAAVLAGWVVEPIMQFTILQQYNLPFAAGAGLGTALGGSVGLIIAIVLLRLKVLPLSFADEPELPEGVDPDDPNYVFYHPHPRKEVAKELLFLALPIAGAMLGYALSMDTSETRAQLPGGGWLEVLGGVLLGILVGGGIVWATRILGTLAFGKEAMGLGDVHLMAGIGAVIGWQDTVLAFFIAPFFGLVAAAVTAGLAALMKGEVRVIPYGPYLCGATLVVMLYRNAIWDLIF